LGNAVTDARPARLASALSDAYGHRGAVRRVLTRAHRAEAWLILMSHHSTDRHAVRHAHRRLAFWQDVFLELLSHHTTLYH
jgi:hypothetical protein